MRLEVVLPTLHRRAVIDRCLAHLAAQDDRDFRVIVVADAAAQDVDGLRARVAASGLDAQVLVAPQPGASAARNTGWRAAFSDVVLFLDDDVLADPGLVRAHRALHRARPEVGVGGLGRLRWADAVEATPFLRWLDQGWLFDTGALAALETTGWWHLYTCDLSLKVAALRAAGGLDEEGFPFLYEDLDLGRRLHERLGGLELVLLDDAGAQHDQQLTLDGWRSRVRVIAAAERRFITRYPDVAPYFLDRFSAVRAAGPVRGRGARLAPHVPPSVPFVGPRVRGAADRFFAWELSGPFLEAWEASASDPGPGAPPPPDVVA